MITLILAGESIAGVSNNVTEYADGWSTPDCLYPRNAGITGIATVTNLPSDFAPNLYKWHNNTLEYIQNPVQVKPVPQKITPLQARRALRAVGILGKVNNFVANQTDEVKDSWEYCVEVNRFDPFILSARLALNMTDEQIDDLFRLAATL